MGIFSKIGHWRRTFIIWVTIPGLAAFAVFTGVQDLGPSWRAKQGQGIVGTYTATHEECRRRSCTMHGTFTADDGSSKRENVILRDSGDSLRRGDTAPALDSGDEDAVFPPGGGAGVPLAIGFLTVGTLVLAIYLFVLVRKVRRRRTSPASPDPAAVVQ
jgi:hypothetical protein